MEVGLGAAGRGRSTAVLAGRLHNPSVVLGVLALAERRRRSTASGVRPVRVTAWCSHVGLPHLAVHLNPPRGVVECEAPPRGCGLLADNGVGTASATRTCAS